MIIYNVFSLGKLRATVQDAFPGLELSPASDRRAWHLRMRQLNAHSMRRPLTNTTQRKVRHEPDILNSIEWEIFTPVTCTLN